VDRRLGLLELRILARADALGLVDELLGDVVDVLLVGALDLGARQLAPVLHDHLVEDVDGVAHEQAAPDDAAVDVGRFAQRQRDGAPDQVGDRGLDPGLLADRREVGHRRAGVDGERAVHRRVVRLVPRRHGHLAPGGDALLQPEGHGGRITAIARRARWPAPRAHAPADPRAWTAWGGATRGAPPAARPRTAPTCRPP